MTILSGSPDNGAGHRGRDPGGGTFPLPASGTADAFSRYRNSRQGPQRLLGPNLVLLVLGIAVAAVWVYATPRLLGSHAVVLQIRHRDTFPDGVMTVVQIDVGQGDGTFIHTPGGKNVLIDCGEGENPDNTHSRQYPSTRDDIEPFLAAHGIYDLDLMVLTHPHSDHGGGMGPLIEWLYDHGGSVKRFIDPGFAVPSKFYQSILESVEKHKIEYMPVIDPATNAPAEYKQLGGSLIGRDPLGDPTIAFQILGPFHKIGDPKGQEANENSVAMRIQCGDISFLLDGDAEARLEDELAAFWGRRLKSTVAFPPHHGSHTSDEPNWLKMVNPEYMSASCFPPIFGHPAAAALVSWKTFINPPLKLFLRTDMNGDIWYRTDGKKLAIRTQFPVKSHDEQWEPGKRQDWNSYRRFEPNEPTTWDECLPAVGTDEL